MEKSERLLLIDTDAFCKLGVSDLLGDAVAIFGTSIRECGRLPALPYMLKKGRLRSTLGEVHSDHLADLAFTMPIAPRPSEQWLEALSSIDAVDPGEALLVAASAEYNTLTITGDKRAICAIANIPILAQALDERLVAIEAILIELYNQLGDTILRNRIQALMEIDAAVRSCFLSSVPLTGLLSYFTDLASQASPLRLWQPPSIGSL